MESRVLKQLYSELEKGRINEVLDLISTSNCIKITDKSAVNIFIMCCTLCINNSSNLQFIFREDLVKLLKIIFPYIKNPQDTQITSYLQSMYHILKFVLIKEQYECIDELEELLIPHFLPDHLEYKQLNVYNSIVTLLYNTLVKISNEEYPKCSQSIFTMCKMVAKMSVKNSEPESYLEKALNCSYILVALKFDIEKQIDYYFCTVSMLKEIKQPTAKFYSTMINYFAIIWNNILLDNNFAKFESFYKSNLNIFKDNSTIFNVYVVLGFWLSINPIKEDISFLEKAEKAMKGILVLANEITAAIKNTCCVLLQTFLKYFEVKKDTWTQLEERTHTMFIRFAQKLLALFESNCFCASLEKKLCFESHKFGTFIYKLICLQVRNAKKISNPYLIATKDFFAKFYSMLMCLKQKGCKNWEKNWKSVGILIYNVGVILYSSGREDESEIYFLELLKHIVEFETGETNILKESLLTVSLNSICDSASKKENVKKCMAFTAFHILLQEESRVSSFKRWWIVSKFNSKKDSKEDLQQVTLVDALEKYKNFIDPITDVRKILTIDQKIELLQFELEMYKSKWSSRTPMMATFTQLCKIADEKTILNTSVNIFGDCEINIHDDMIKILYDIQKKCEKRIEKSSNDVDKFNLGVLYHVHYQYAAKNAIAKNCDEMEKGMITESKYAESSEPPDAIPKDPNEECNIVSCYESLRLNKFLSVIKYLHQSLKLFEEISITVLAAKQMKILYNVLLKIGHEYKLQDFSSEYLKAFLLALRIAELLHDPIGSINCIALGIDNKYLNRSELEQLLNKADLLMKNVESDKENIKVLLTYLINKCKATFYTDYKKAYEIYMEALGMLQSSNSKEELNVIKAQLMVLHYKFIALLPCNVQVERHQNVSMLELHNAQSIIFEEYRNFKANDSNGISVLFDLNLELVKLLHNLRWPREVRCYSKDTLLLAQKMVLPLRCVTYLSYLAHADIATCRLDECQIRLSGIEEILCLEKQTIGNTAVPVTEKEIQNDEIEQLTNDVREIVLDLPDTYKKQVTLSSPTILIKGFQFPSFFKHEIPCDCFFCNSIEYHRLLQVKAKLDSLYHDYSDNTPIARDFFKGAIKLNRMLNKLYKARNVEFEMLFCDIYGEILLESSNSHMRNSDKEQALELNTELLLILEPRQLQHNFLYQEALMQRICFLTIGEPQETINNVNELATPEELVEPTTPDTKVSVIDFNQAVSNYSLPKRRIRKPRKFVLSPTEHESTQKSVPKIKIFQSSDFTQSTLTPSCSKAESKLELPKSTRKRNCKEETSSKENDSNDLNINNLIVEKPKIEIFSECGVRMKNKKKLDSNAAGVNKNANTDTPRACSSNSEDPTASVLKKKTRLLTEKLKQKSHISDKNQGITGARKNLMKDLGSDGTVRRSSRKKS